MTQIYNIISIVAFSLSGVAFVFSIFFWFRFKIWSIIGELSGRTAKKSIAQMREENEKSGNKIHAPTPRGRQRGPITEMMQREKAENNNGKNERLKKKDDALGTPTTVLAQETGLLGGAREVQIEETCVLGNAIEMQQIETERLDKQEQNKNLVRLELVQNIVLVHTEEYI